MSKSRTDAELLGVMLRQIQSKEYNDITNGLCYFSGRMKWDCIITDWERHRLERIIENADPYFHDEYPDEFKGKATMSGYYFTRGDWKIRERFVKYLIKIKKQNDEQAI